MAFPPDRGNDGSSRLARARPEEELTNSEGHPKHSRFLVDPTACAVLLEARSNVGTVSFGSTRISGSIDAVRAEDRVDTDPRPRARLSVPLASLRSGNALYDAELHQRLSAKRFPLVTIELENTAAVGGADYQVSGKVTIRGVTSTLVGAVTLTFPEPDALLVTGEHVVDIRDFDIEVPSVLMLRIYPDVRVSLRLLARQSFAQAAS